MNPLSFNSESSPTHATTSYFYSIKLHFSLSLLLAFFCTTSDV